MPMTSELNYRTPVSGDFEAACPAIDAKLLAQEDWSALVNVVRRAIVEDGFLRIALTESQTRDIISLREAMASFFDRTDTEKEIFRDRGAGFGWTPSFEEPAYQPGTVASLESFDVSLQSLRGPNRPDWPVDPDLESRAESVWRLYTGLGRGLLELMARATGMDSTFLLENCDSQDLNSLRLLHYPRQEDAPAENEVGIAAHTDFECITLLYQSEPGLELRKPDSSWVTAPAEDGSLIVLFDDMLERWTNGEVQATGHRVRRSTVERFSIVMFVAANKGVRVAPLPNFVGAGRPALYGELEQGSHIEAEIARARELRANS